MNFKFNVKVNNVSRTLKNGVWVLSRWSVSWKSSHEKQSGQPCRGRGGSEWKNLYANSISILSFACISCEVTCHVSRVSCIVNLTIISNNNLIQTACTVSFQGGGVKSPFLPQEAKKQSKTVSKIFPLSMKRCWHYFVAIKGGEEGPLPAPPSRCHC